MTSEVTIAARFHGPPESANGGYACGRLAAFVDGPAEVTLRVPPPLDRPLRVERREGGGAALRDGEVLVAEARPAAVELDVPEPVALAAAEAAAARYPWRVGHPYPTCFVCGPQRDDGLAIYPGPVDGRELFAAPWTPAAELADEDGTVRDEFVWAAIDCPGGIVTDLFGDHGRLLLGRLTADLRGAVRAGEPHVLETWPLERDGRKLHTATALRTAAGEVLALSRAVWIEVA